MTGGRSVRFADDPASGTRCAESDRPAAIVLNCVVPQEDLKPFIERLTERAPESRVLEIARPAASPGRPAPASGHLTQPFDADDLLHEIDRLSGAG
jgi:hypothetical protein